RPVAGRARDQRSPAQTPSARDTTRSPWHGRRARSRCDARAEPRGKRLDGGAVGPREAARRRFAPRQPGEPRMLARIHANGNAIRYLDPVHVLRVVRRTRSIAMAPLDEDLEVVLHVPIDHASVTVRIDAGLLGELAHGGARERLVRFSAAG